jgi:flagellar protein FlaF
LLWSIIQADVAEKDNALPEELKANLMSLSIFVDKQTSKGLTNINLNIAEGLMEGA